MIGSLLGDGGVYILGSCQNACFSERHSLKQSNYLKWKAGILIKHFGGKVYPYKAHSHYLSKNGGNPRKINSSEGLRLQTRTSPILTEFRHRWYPNGKKIVPEEDLEKMSSLGLAVWYQDDGWYDYRSRSCGLAVNDFKGQELAIQRFFKDRLGINPYTTSGVKLRFPAKDSDKFLRLIAEHIHPLMTYKLGHLHPSNQARVEEEHEKMLQYSRRYRQANPDGISLIHCRYRQKNREGIRQRNREFMRKYHKKNRAKLLRKKREYYWKNHEVILQRKREYRQRRKGT